MGEAKKEEPEAVKDQVPVEAKKEEKKEEKGEKKEEEQEKKEKGEEKKGEDEAKQPSPPPPVVLHVDLHCMGCAKKIEKCLLKCKGVEGVTVEMGKNEVTVKGIVEPQALCMRILKKAHRKATVISPLPPPSPVEGEPEKPPQVVHSQVSEVSAVEIQVNMHCEACAEQLQKKIMKMKGVQSAEADLGSSKLKVTGTVAGEKIVEYIHRRTGKLATVIPPPPPPEPPKEEEPAKDGGEKPKADDGKGDAEKDKTSDEKTADSEKEKEAAGKDKKDESGGGGGDEKAKGEEEALVVAADNDAMKKVMYWNRPAWSVPSWGYVNYFPPPPPPQPLQPPPWSVPTYYSYGYEEEMMRLRMMQLMPPAPYVTEPPPQLFSDENPNACTIS